MLAAAIKSRARFIVTDNLRDFPDDALTIWNVEAVSTDDVVPAQIDSWRNPPGTTDDVLDRLERDGLLESAATLPT